MKQLKSNLPMMMDVFSPNVLNRLFTDVWNNGDENFSETDFRPSSEVIKTEKGYQLRVTLPGVKKDDIAIDLEGNTLTLSGERKSEHTENKNNIVRSEITYGRFSRTFTLNSDIDRSKISADYQDGILVVDLPVDEKAVAQRIKIGK